MFLLGNTLIEYPEERKEARKVVEKTLDAVDWDPQIKFASLLHIRGESYKQPSLFDVDPCPHDVGVNGGMSEGMSAISPKGNWCYRERYFKAGASLHTCSGNRRGEIYFDADVLIPMIHKLERNGRWSTNPWMSFTPSEFFSLRAGTKLARGHTVVAGLGMGYQLEQVCRKRNVKRVTLVERDPDIVDWVLPKIDLHGKDVEVVIGDANDLVPKIEADVALVDIYETYGGNGCTMRYRCEKMGKTGCLWIWGSA